MTVYFNYAENYIKSLVELGITKPMFTEKAVKDKKINLSSYLFKHYPNQKIEYMILGDGLSLCNNQNDRKVKIPICDDWKELDELQKTHKYIAIRSPIREKERFLAECFKRKKVKFHGLNVNSMNVLMNFPFDSVDINPFFTVSKFNEVILPNGKKLKTDKYIDVLKQQKTLSMLGFTVKDIHNGPRDSLVKFNIKSYLFVCEQGESLRKGKIALIEKPKQETTRDKNYLKKKHKGATVPETLKKTQVRRALAVRQTGVLKNGYQLCDNCAIKDSCPYKVDNSVCARSKQFRALVKHFQTRDVGLLKDSMAKVLQIQSERYMRGTQFEKDSGGFIDREVTNLENSFFKNIETFLKVLKPSEQPTNVYNLANQQVNVALAMKELEGADLTKEQKATFAEKLGEVIRRRKSESTGDSTVVTEKS